MAKRKHKVGDLIMYTYVSSDTTNTKHDLGVITKIVNGIDGLVDGTTRYYVDWFDEQPPFYLYETDVETYKGHLDEFLKAHGR